MHFPLTPSLLLDHSTALLLVFSELDTVSMETINIDKPFPPPFEVENSDDYPTSPYGHVTSISATFHDASLIFGQTSLQERQSRQRTMTTDGSGIRTTLPRFEEQNEQDYYNPYTTSGTPVKVEEWMEEIKDVDPAGTEGFSQKNNGFL